MLEKVRQHILLFVLIAIAFILCFANYTPGTILSGWDSLHPEFNFGLNIKREISGVFRENQGLGAVSAHAAMADLPHILILFIFDSILDKQFLRYFYIFLNLILGAIGMYFFLYKIVLKDKVSSFLGGLFYLLNLGTLQQFVVPFEMFTTQFMSLPWLFLFATLSLYSTSTKNFNKFLLYFSISTILASPMAFAPTLWYVYFFVLATYLFSLIFLKIHLEGAHPVTFEVLRRTFKRVFLLIFLTIILNLYWILPNIYYILNHGSGVSEALTNKIFSPQAFLYNKEFGNIVDISLLKSFLFDWNVFASNNNYEKLLTVWIQHLNNPIVFVIGFIFALVTVIGLIKGVLRKNLILISFLPAISISLLFLFNDNFPTSGIYNFLNTNFPFFKEAYRFPANKVFIIFTFIYSLAFAYGILTIKEKFSLLLRHRQPEHSQGRGDPNGIFAMTGIALIIFYMFPAFSGNFISPYMRIKIPQMYFDMFEYFNTKPKTARIANLPIHSIFGWDYTNWGFQGAGFVWFGIEQPILNRDFDRWSKYNEYYYKDMSYAIYSQNQTYLKRTLEKYNIKYILLDKSIIAPQYDPKILFYNETQNLLESQPFIHKVKDFENKLIIYQVDLQISNVQKTIYPIPTDNQGKISPKTKIVEQAINTIKTPNTQINLKIQKEITPNISQLPYTLAHCDNDIKGIFGISFENKTNSFSLFANDSKVCMTIQLKMLLEKEKIQPNSILGLNLNYKSKSPVGACLSNIEDKVCIDYGISIDATDYFSLGDKKLDKLGLTFILDAKDNILSQDATYEDIKIILATNILESLPSDIQRSSFLNRNTIKHSNEITNCKKRNFYNPFQIRGKNLNYNIKHFIKYISDDGITCDRFSYSELPQDKAYLIIINSRNIKGLPLYLCVENNVSKHCDIYANLSSSSDFVENTFILMPQIQEKKGYDVIISNFGIKGSSSINDLKSIQILPISIDLFDQARSGISQINDDSIYILDQSYEKGWRAYEVRSSKFEIRNWLNKVFPFFFGEELKKHILVNNWANGWSGVPHSRTSSPANEAAYDTAKERQTWTSTIVIIFLPQYLQYLGFVVLFGAILYLILNFLRTSWWSSPNTPLPK